jgi:hypothetical protein
MHDDPMIDPLDREIARALAVDSSPEFVSRVRQRIAAEPEPRSWPLWWLTAGAIALSSAAAIVTVVTLRGPQPVSVASPLVARATDAVADLPDVASGFSRTDRRPALSRPAAGPERPGLQQRATQSEPEIVIDPREASALRSLLAGARSGAIDLEPVLRASKPAVMELEPVTDIDIPLITFEPIAQGVQR